MKYEKDPVETLINKVSFIQTHTETHLRLRHYGVVASVQVLDDAGDAERPRESQQIGQVTEGAAEQDGAAERSVHGAPDGGGAVGVLSRLCRERDVK